MNLQAFESDRRIELIKPSTYIYVSASAGVRLEDAPRVRPWPLQELPQLLQAEAATVLRDPRPTRGEGHPRGSLDSPEATASAKSVASGSLLPPAAAGGGMAAMGAVNTPGTAGGGGGGGGRIAVPDMGLETPRRVMLGAPMTAEFGHASPLNRLTPMPSRDSKRCLYLFLSLGLFCIFASLLVWFLLPDIVDSVTSLSLPVLFSFHIYVQIRRRPASCKVVCRLLLQQHVASNGARLI